MEVLLVHQNFPGQYVHLAAALVARGDRVIAIGGPGARPLRGVSLHRYDPMPAAGIPECHPWVSDQQIKCLRAEAVAELLAGLVAGGLSPDLVVGHPGWGELLVVKDVLPGVPVIHHVEFIYQMQGGDVDFDPEFLDLDWRTMARLRLRRATQLLALQDLDWGWAPTPWQASTVPLEYRQRLSVIHEGVDTDQIAPRPGSFIDLKRAARRFAPGDEVVTFVARNLEPYRGIHSFLRMLPILQRRRPEAIVILVGGPGVSYGRPPEGGGSWKDVLLRELEGQLDLERIHFVGKVPHPVLHELFRISACHVYLTVPFVLSWSLLEAMSCGATVVGSATQPVQDVIEDRVNGLLVDFFDLEAMADTVASVLADPAAYRPLGEAARRSVVERFDLRRVCLPRQLELVDRIAGGGALRPVTRPAAAGEPLPN